MGVPALENGPWVFNVNNWIGNQGSQLLTDQLVVWTMKDVLVSFAQWSVVASSNTSSYSNIGDPGDVDHWDSIADINVNSWVVLENSVTGEQLCIKVHATDRYVHMYYSAIGDFASDGDATTQPTSVAFTYPNLGYVFDSSTYTYGMTVNAMVSADGKCTRIFICQKAGSSIGAYFFCMEEVASPNSHWTSTNKRCCNYVDPISLSATTNQQDPYISDIDDTDQWFVYLKDASSEGKFLCQITSEMYGPMLTPGSETRSVFTDSVKKEWLDGGYTVSSIGLYKPTGDKNGPIGRLQDIYLAPADHYMYSTYDSAGSRAWIKVGCFLLPWNGTAPVIP